MLRIFPDTYFSYEDLTMQEHLLNTYFLELLVHHPLFEEICESILKHKVDKFKDIFMPTIVSVNFRFDGKVILLHKLTGVECKMIHHVEKQTCKASWVNLLFFALK